MHFSPEIFVNRKITQRAAVQHFEKGSGEELIRLDSDGPPKSGSPHIYAEKVHREAFFIPESL